MLEDISTQSTADSLSSEEVDGGCGGIEVRFMINRIFGKSCLFGLKGPCQVFSSVLQFIDIAPIFSLNYSIMFPPSTNRDNLGFD